MLHSQLLVALWVLIISDYILIHLFVEDEILKCRLQNINVTSLLTEFPLHRCLNFNCGTSYLMFDP